MKNYRSLLLAVLAVLSFCVSFRITASADPTLSATPALDAADKESEYLAQLMADFAENIQPGTAGASLKAAKEAVRLMDWGSQSEMTYEEIAEVVDGYFEPLDDEAAEKYLEQLDQLNETYQQLLTEGQEEFLASAGCTDTAYPWGGEPIPAVEAFFMAADEWYTGIYTGDFADFLETYYQAINEQWSEEELSTAGINFTNRALFELPDALDTFGFTVRDVNFDGTEELLVGYVDDGKFVNDLYYMYDDGFIEPVIQGGAYNEEYHVCNDGTICKYSYFNEGHKGYHYYTLQEGWLSCFGSIICDDSVNPYNIWYIGTDDDWDVRKCSYFPPDMVLQQVANYEAKYVDNEYTPFSALHEAA